MIRALKDYHRKRRWFRGWSRRHMFLHFAEVCMLSSNVWNLCCLSNRFIYLITCAMKETARALKYWTSEQI